VELIVFYLFAAVAVLFSLSMILFRKAMYSALSLIVCLCSLAALFYLAGGPFIAAIQVIVYAGAIMVMVLFVIMLTKPESVFPGAPELRRLPFIVLPLAAVLAAILVWIFAFVPSMENDPGSPLFQGDVRSIAEALFREYLLPFEATSILILVAVIGAVVLTRSEE
jgi:NADH-quinone oxidoreductase subunit J